MVLNQIQVTAVQGQPLATGAGSTDAGVGETPSGAYLVTLAGDSAAIEKIVAAKETGKIWLSAEPAEAKSSAAIIGALPFVIMGMLTVLNPKYLRPLMDTQTGHILIEKKADNNKIAYKTHQFHFDETPLGTVAAALSKTERVAASKLAEPPAPKPVQLMSVST